MSEICPLTDPLSSHALQEAYACLRAGQEDPATSLFTQFDVLPTIASTNAALKQFVQQEGLAAANGRVLLALEQTQGRGTRGRSFFSPYGSGLYLSFCLALPDSFERLNWLTPAAALAMRQAILHCCGIGVQIKWVNDLIKDGRKLAGILCERGAGASFVLGIGLNLCVPREGFPPEIRDKATALFADASELYACSELQNTGIERGDLRRVQAAGEAEAAVSALHIRLSAAFLTQFERLFSQLHKGGRPALSEMRERYRAASSLAGRRVRYAADAEKEPVGGPVYIFEDIDEEARAVLRAGDGRRICIDSGELRLL